MYSNRGRVLLLLSTSSGASFQIFPFDLLGIALGKGSLESIKYAGMVWPNDIFWTNPTYE